MSAQTVIQQLQHLVFDPATQWGRNGDSVRKSLADARVGLTPLGLPVSLVAEDHECREFVRCLVAKDRKGAVKCAARIAWHLHDHHGVRADIANQAVNCYAMAANVPDVRLPVDPALGPDKRGRPWTHFWVRAANLGLYVSVGAIIVGAGLWYWDTVVRERVAKAVAVLENERRPLRERVTDPLVDLVRDRPEVQLAIEAASRSYATSVLSRFSDVCERSDPMSTAWETAIYGFKQLVEDPLLTESTRIDLAASRDRGLARRLAVVSQAMKRAQPGDDAPVSSWDEYVREVGAAVAVNAPYLAPDGQAELRTAWARAVADRGGVVVRYVQGLAANEQETSPEDLGKIRDAIAAFASDPLLPPERQAAVKDVLGGVMERRGAAIVRKLESSKPAPDCQLPEASRYYETCQAYAAPHDVDGAVQSKIDAFLLAADALRTDLMVKEILRGDPGADSDPVGQTAFLARLADASVDASLSEAARSKLRALLVDRSKWCEARLRAALSAPPAGDLALGEQVWAPVFAAAKAYGAITASPTDEDYYAYAAELVQFAEQWFVKRERTLRVSTIRMEKSSKWSPAFSKPDITLAVLIDGVSCGEKVVKSLPDNETLTIDLTCRPVMSWGSSCIIRADDRDGQVAEFLVTPLMEQLSQAPMKRGGTPGLAIGGLLDGAGPQAVPKKP
jgi:hypothetical protein